MAGSADCLHKLERSQSQAETTFLRVKEDAWKVLAEAQAALAYTCIVSFGNSSTKLDFLFEGFGSLVQGLQTRCEEEWASFERFSHREAKLIVRVLRRHLRDYHLAVQSEIVKASPTFNFTTSGRGGGFGAPSFGAPAPTAWTGGFGQQHLTPGRLPQLPSTAQGGGGSGAAGNRGRGKGSGGSRPAGRAVQPSAAQTAGIAPAAVAPHVTQRWSGFSSLSVTL